MLNWNIGNKFKQQIPSREEALPGRDTALQIKPEHFVLKTSMLEPYPAGTEVVYLGMGCFWGAEKLFWSLKGVYTTAVGYGAGYTPNPTYEEVCTGRTGHNELVKVVFHADVLPFAELLKVFWQNHNPCEGMRQGNDVGTQYRSGIYPTTAAQYAIAQASKQRYDAALKAANIAPSTTELQSELTFYYAEQYHQQYLAKNPGGYCPNHSCDATGLPQFPAGD